MQHNVQTGSIILLKDITQSKKLIEVTKAESRYKSEFLSNMSHEIRTPMNAIIGMVNIGKSSDDMERKNYSLSRIEDASKHLLGIINDILDLSKIEAGKFELSTQEFVFEKMLQRVVNVVKFRADEKNQTFTIQMDKTIPKNLLGDDQRLAQVITNLIGNAVKFTPENGSIKLNTKLLNEENNSCTIQFEVSDSGIGISGEQQARLFKSFTQAETDTSRKFGGTGLGLSISKNIVELMGGKIWIESELGKGATFAFTVQLEKGEEEKQGLFRQNVNWSCIRILAVDTDSYSLAYFNDIMQRIGVSCDTAGSYEEALRFIEEKGAYNIYFIDQKLSGNNRGIELTRIIKSKTAAEANSIVVLFSGVDWNEIADEAKAAGVDKFTQKPLFPSTIVDIINSFLGVTELKQDKEGTDGADSDGLFKGVSILLAEDMEINREIVLALLEPTLVEIDCAENGLQAVQKFSEAPDKYRMIFMDVQMPEMDGYEATRKIREIETENAKHSPQLPEPPKRIPIIAMTANVFREDIEKCLEAGMNGHIGKPIAYEAVVNQLKQYCLH